MSDITLEKIDILRERTGVSYTEAKDALEKCDGNIVDSLIYLENTIEENKCSIKDDICTTKEEFVNWIKGIAKKGNVNRIRVKKDDKVIMDIPVNAGLAAGIIALAYPALIAVGVLSAVVTKVTVEIVKNDGSVEVVNRLIKNTAKDVKSKVSDITDDMKEKMESMTSDVKEKFDKFDNDKGTSSEDNNMYKYTVKFDDINDKNNTDNNDDR